MLVSDITQTTAQTVLKCSQRS